MKDFGASNRPQSEEQNLNAVWREFNRSFLTESQCVNELLQVVCHKGAMSMLRR